MQKYLLDNFKYIDGQLIRIIKSGKANIGDILGSFSSGYLIANFRTKMYKVHRLIWIYHYGDIALNMMIDHIDRDRMNNRIENLRLVSSQENNFNRKCKGYSFDKATGKYRAYIAIGSKRINFKRVDTENEARAIYIVAKLKYHKIGGYND